MREIKNYDLLVKLMYIMWGISALLVHDIIGKILIITFGYVLMYLSKVGWRFD